MMSVYATRDAVRDENSFVLSSILCSLGRIRFVPCWHGFTSDARYLFLWGKREFIVVDVRTGRDLWRRPIGRLPLSYRAELQRLFFFGTDHQTVEILDAKSGKSLATRPLAYHHYHGKGRYVPEWLFGQARFEKSWKRLWFGTPSSNSLRIVDVASGRSVGELDVPRLQTASVSEDGRTLLTVRHAPGRLIVEFWDVPLHPSLQWVLGPPLAILLFVLFLARWRRTRTQRTSDTPRAKTRKSRELAALDDRIDKNSVDVLEWVWEGNPNCHDLD
jgi:hypothetical protein